MISVQSGADFLSSLIEIDSLYCSKVGHCLCNRTENERNKLKSNLVLKEHRGVTTRIWGGSGPLGEKLNVFVPSGFENEK